MKSGVLLVATGDKYVDEAMPLIASIRHHMPNVTIHLVTDCSTCVEDKLVDSLTRFEVDLTDVPAKFRGFLFRDLALELSPFDLTVHMDCDTILGAPIFEMFHALTRFDLAVGAAPAKVCSFGNSSECLPEDCATASVPVVPRINCGVIGYTRKSIQSGFFKHWIYLYKKGISPAIRRGRTKFSDQSVFRKAVWETGINFLLLPTEFNFRTGAPQYLDGPVRIAHGRPPMGRHSLIDFINSELCQRMYLPYQGMLIRNNGKWVQVTMDSHKHNINEPEYTLHSAV